MRRLENCPESVRLVVTVALMLALVSLALTIWNPAAFRVAEPLFSGKVFTIGSIRAPYNSVIVFGIAALVAVGLWALLYRSASGVAMRATVDNPDLVRLSGRSPQRSARQAWVISTMLAGLAGILIAPTLTLSAASTDLAHRQRLRRRDHGDGSASLTMTFAGALILGLSTSYAVGYVQSEYLQGLVGTIPVILLFVALLVLRPSRLGGSRGASHATRPGCRPGREAAVSESLAWS